MTNREAIRNLQKQYETLPEAEPSTSRERAIGCALTVAYVVAEWESRKSEEPNQISGQIDECINQLSRAMDEWKRGEGL